MQNGRKLTVVERAGGDQSTTAIPKERVYTSSALKSWVRIGYRQFSDPVETYPWAGRSRRIAWRIVVSNYIEPADVAHAVWVRERALRAAPGDWLSQEAGTSYISALLRERSGGRWIEEIDELAAKLPKVSDYMEAEWGEDTRALMSVDRRTAMHDVNCHGVQFEAELAADEEPVAAEAPGG